MSVCREVIEEGRKIFYPQIKERNYFSILEKILKDNNIPEYYYSIGQFMNDSICLEYKDGKWIVYSGERNHRAFLEEWDNFYEAGCSLFESVVLGKDKLEMMKQELYKAVNKRKENGSKLFPASLRRRHKISAS